MVESGYGEAIDFLVRGIATMRTEGRPATDAVVSTGYLLELVHCIASQATSTTVPRHPEQAVAEPVRAGHYYCGEMFGVRIWRPAASEHPKRLTFVEAARVVEGGVLTCGCYEHECMCGGV